MLLRLHKRAKPSNGSAHNERIDLLGAFIRVDGFGVSHKAGHIVIQLE